MQESEIATIDVAQLGEGIDQRFVIGFFLIGISGMLEVTNGGKSALLLSLCKHRQCNYRPDT